RRAVPPPHLLTCFGPMTRLVHHAVGIAASRCQYRARRCRDRRNWHRTQWVQSSEVSLQEFGGAATRLPKALDFGDSYADVVLPSQVVGGVPMVVFFQMDKTTHERPRHGVNREVDPNFQFR